MQSYYRPQRAGAVCVRGSRIPRVDSSFLEALADQLLLFPENLLRHFMKEANDGLFVKSLTYVLWPPVPLLLFPLHPTLQGGVESQVQGLS